MNLRQLLISEVDSLVVPQKYIIPFPPFVWQHYPQLPLALVKGINTMANRYNCLKDESNTVTDMPRDVD